MKIIFEGVTRDGRRQAGVTDVDNVLEWARLRFHRGWQSLEVVDEPGRKLVRIVSDPDPRFVVEV